MDKRYQPPVRPGGDEFDGDCWECTREGRRVEARRPKRVSIVERLKDQPFTVHSQKFQTTPVWLPM
jgi:hypothetical protein